MECAAGLDVLVAKRILEKSEVQPGKDRLVEIVSMFVGLIKSVSQDRFYEERAEYMVGGQDLDVD